MTTDQTLRLTDGTPAAEHRWHAAAARRDALAAMRNGDDLLTAGKPAAAETAYQRAATSYRRAATHYINAAGVRGGTTDDTAAALKCCRQAHGADLLAEGCR